MPKKITQEEFINKVTSIHGNSIDFSKAVYVNDSTPVECKCNKCGNVWFATPNNLTHNRGCPNCKHKSTKYTLNEWISLAEKIHKGKYDLSLVNEYHSREQKIKIICHEKDDNGKEHGAFEIRSASFLNGRGCPKCAIKIIKEKQVKPFSKMVDEARKIHGDKYEYDEKTYSNVRTKMKIICPIHGEFWQTPHKHITSKNGCPKCKGGVKLTQDEFIKKAEKILNGKYNLSKVKYVNSTTKIIVTCKEHGDFLITPHSLLQGHGCPQCAEEKKCNATKYDIKKVIEMARNIHGDKYIYNRINYVNANTPIKIICPTHGEFWQTPSKHIHSKHGCPKCSQSHLEEEISKLFSENNIEHVQSKRFDWLGLQHLDFYLPKYNIAIECQGEQHYKPISFNEDKSKETLERIFLSQQERDQRKKRLCEENGVKLLYYTAYNKINEDELTFRDKDKLLEEITKNDKFNIT